MYKRVPFQSFVVSLLASTAMISGAAQALEPSGSAIRVDPAVEASGGEGSRLLQVEGAVFMGDQIVAGPNGLAQIRFVDDTKIVIGPNSRLTIDSFVYNPDNTASDVTVSAIKGAFRFISGNSPSSVYSIRTPTMTIGVRGTIVDINARGPDSSAIFLEGGGELCDAGGQCIDVVADCTMYVAPIGGGFAQASGLERRQRLAAFFPFISGQQAALDALFRAPISACADPGGGAPFNAPPESGGNKGTPTTEPDFRSPPPPPPPPDPPPSPPPYA